MIRPSGGWDPGSNPGEAICKKRKMHKHRKYLPKILREFHYPKILLLITAILITYLLFNNPLVNLWINNLESLSYLGIFIAGMLFSFGFTAPIAVGFFIVLNPEKVFLAAIVGGIGSLISDLFIFNLIRVSFMGEFIRLKKLGAMKKINYYLENHISHKIKNYFLYVFAGIIIASPLPDEIGVTMLAGLTHIKQRVLAIISFTLNTVGILIILYLSH